mmetsp:Transcript_26950/g.55943  ORF Transcript_26950/g.55943 Transcript_26950/m.55943 type:complete len:132 (-) Transcript_26950:75-470(-)
MYAFDSISSSSSSRKIRACFLRSTNTVGSKDLSFFLHTSFRYSSGSVLFERTSEFISDSSSLTCLDTICSLEAAHGLQHQIQQTRIFLLTPGKDFKLLEKFISSMMHTPWINWRRISWSFPQNNVALLGGY